MSPPTPFKQDAQASRFSFRRKHVFLALGFVSCEVLTFFFTVMNVTYSPVVLKKLVTFPYYLVVASIIRNEGPYLAEWLEYHLLVGVQHFFLYDNDSTDRPRSVLCPYLRDGLVNYTQWPGIHQQLNVNAFVIQHLRNISFWVAIIDVDEFILPMSNLSIGDTLRHFENVGSVILYWLIYGSNGQINRTSELVMERFVDHVPFGHRWNHIVKSIINPRLVRSMGSHEVTGWENPQNGFSSDCNGTYILHWIPWELRHPRHNCLRINHYWSKSFEEFVLKIERGQVANVSKRKRSEFNQFGRVFGNTDTTLKGYAKDVKRELSKRKQCKDELL
jgi:hypothetical protein